MFFQNRVFQRNCEKLRKITENSPKIPPKTLPKTPKIQEKSHKIVKKTQDDLRCEKKKKKLDGLHLVQDLQALERAHDRAREHAGDAAARQVAAVGAPLGRGRLLAGGRHD